MDIQQGKKIKLSNHRVGIITDKASIKKHLKLQGGGSLEGVVGLHNAS